MKGHYNVISASSTSLTYNLYGLSGHFYLTIWQKYDMFYAHIVAEIIVNRYASHQIEKKYCKTFKNPNSIHLSVTVKLSKVNRVWLSYLLCL